MKGNYLFKRDIKGNVLYWKIDSEINDNGIVFFHYYGMLHNFNTGSTFNHYSCSVPVSDLKKLSSSEAKIKQKQVFDREYKSKLKKGYKNYQIIDDKINNNDKIDLKVFIENVVDKTNTDINEFAQPMKCQKFEVNKMNFPLLGQPKYNGVRCIVFKDIFSVNLFSTNKIKILSKEGIEYKVEPFLEDRLYNILLYLEKELGISNPILDGELYIPNVQVTTIAGAARNINNEYNKKLQYVIFDLAIENVIQFERLLHIKSLTERLLVPVHNNQISVPSIFVSPIEYIYSDHGALEYLQECLALGYEGAVVREIESEYAFGQRPKFIRKLKKFIDEEFEIIDVVKYNDDGNKIGFGVKFVCKNNTNDLIFESVVIGNYETRLNYFNNKENIIGKNATIKFYERTKNDIPFHSNVIAIRDYE